jgi:hypothetical protein
MPPRKGFDAMTDSGELSELTRRVIDAARAYQDHFGESMQPLQLRQLAHDNVGASYRAAIILVLGMGLDRNGEPLSLEYRHRMGVYVGDAETAIALRQYGRERIRARLVGRFAP